MSRRYPSGRAIPEALPEAYVKALNKNNCGNCLHNVKRNCAKWGGSQIQSSYVCASYKVKNVSVANQAAQDDQISVKTKEGKQIQSKRNENIRPVRRQARQADRGYNRTERRPGAVRGY